MLRSYVEKVERFPTPMDTIPEGSGQANKCTSFVYDDLEHRDLNQIITKKKPYCIILLQVKHKAHTEEVGHFVAIIRHEANSPMGKIHGGVVLEWFDSYRVPLHKLLQKLTHNSTFIEQSLQNTGHKVVFGKRPLQRKGTYSTCARHLMFRIAMADIPIAKYEQMLHYRGMSPDETVTLCTILSAKPHGLKMSGGAMMTHVAGILKQRERQKINVWL
jgi:hypothetical protein